MLLGWYSRQIGMKQRCGCSWRLSEGRGVVLLRV